MKFTFRETQALHGLVLGMGDKDIAEVMGVSVVMAKTHMATAKKKIGVSNRVLAALWVADHLPELRAKPWPAPKAAAPDLVD